MSRYISIHGHFYQPPRENPWLDVVESQESAYPYHDWNKKITAECYAPLATSQIRDAGKKIIDIVNIYTSISFDLGPTLLSWLERNEPDLYQTILDADNKSKSRFSPQHGSAMAQPYNHMIMPLANSRDKRTQVLWGIKDFEHRFKRKPEGMWLPETACDLETLDIMAEYGIRFTILGSHQAKREREVGDKKWKDTGKADINTKMPYLCKLPSGRDIAIFFYEGPISNEVSFGNLLNDGVSFAKRLIGAFSEGGKQNELVSIATDGETYGHHHRFGDMALAFCLDYIEKNKLAKIINFGSYLDMSPPAREVEIFENTSWSCSHGLERWRSNCGCNSGVNPTWKQHWRAPLREGMDWLRDSLAGIYEKNMSAFSAHPWELRDEYIAVVLDRSSENVELFLSKYIKKRLTREDRARVLKLLESQRFAMLMFTSCQWYFDDISGIETLQGLLYAARAMQLAKEISGISLEEDYLKFLEKAPSNIKYLKNGARIYNTIVKPQIIGLARVGAHYAISSLFEGEKHLSPPDTYSVKKEVYDSAKSGSATLISGTLSVSSEITYEEALVSYAVLQYGAWDLVCGAKDGMEKKSFFAMQKEVKNSFLKGRFDDAAALIGKYFEGRIYSLNHLFKDRQAEVLGSIFYGVSKDIEKTLYGIYEHQYPAIQTVGLFKTPLLKDFRDNLEFALNRDISKMLEDPRRIDRRRLRKLLAEAKKLSIDIDKVTLSFIASEKINQMMSGWQKSATDISLMEDIAYFIKSLRGRGLNLGVRESQNIYFYVGRKLLHSMLKKANSGDEPAKRWTELFQQLGTCLNVQVE